MRIRSALAALALVPAGLVGAAASAAADGGFNSALIDQCNKAVDVLATPVDTLSSLPTRDCTNAAPVHV